MCNCVFSVLAQLLNLAEKLSMQQHNLKTLLLQWLYPKFQTSQACICTKMNVTVHHETKGKLHDVKQCCGSGSKLNGLPDPYYLITDLKKLQNFGKTNTFFSLEINSLLFCYYFNFKHTSFQIRNYSQKRLFSFKPDLDLDPDPDL